MKKTIVALLIAFLSIGVFAQTKDIKTALDEANKLYKTIEALESNIESKKAEYIKDEFETTAEFKERMEREVKSKYKSEYDKLDSYKMDLAALEDSKHIFPKDSFKVELAKYDADNFEYEINITNFIIKNPEKKDEWLSKKLILKIDPKTAKEIKTNWGNYPVELYGTLCYSEKSFSLGGIELRFLDNAKTIMVHGEIDIIPFLNLVFVEGGTFVSTKSNYFNASHYGKGVTINSFYIGIYEVTQAEWIEVMGSNPSYFKGDDLPVESVNWYDCVEYCNKRSKKEGLAPVYKIDKINKDPNNNNEEDEIKWAVTADWSANGYRLPTDAEWEYAATGGQKSKSYTYSGSYNVDEVAEYSGNNDKSTKSVGGKKSNELGLYDMSGNVWEWAWDWYGVSIGSGSAPKGADGGSNRVYRGGGWYYGFAGTCKVSYRAYGIPGYRSGFLGFRVVRSGE